MHRLFCARALLGAAAAMLVALVLASCNKLDPVKTESLCDPHRGFVSMRCSQCLTQPYAPECSICSTEAGKSDPTVCRPNETTGNPSTDVDGGKDGSAPDGDVGTGTAGQSGASGAGAGAGGRGGAAGRPQSGSGGKSGGAGMAGAAGEPLPPGRCLDGLKCASEDPSKPACDPVAQVCVQCVENKDCSGALGVCNPILHVCANCYTDADCPGRKCDRTNMVCVDCEDDCTDPVANSCDMAKHICVDCTSDTGCMDGTENETCDRDRFVCVDCLDDGDCHEDGRSACDGKKQTCVECTGDNHCTADPVNRTCDKDNQVCVDCLDDSGCGGTKPRCLEEEKTCVACLDDPDCSTGHCYDHQCVQCEADDDCDDPNAAHCDPNAHRCVGCTSSAQCGHLSATRACDTANKRCVECNDDTTCGGNSCLRAQHECSDVRVGSVNVCEECQADTMCASPMKCIPQSFSGRNLGNFCAYPASSRSGGRCSSARPYSQSANARSVDGSNQAYCVPPMSTTCKGVLDATTPRGGKTCSGDAVCGEGINDANCNGDQRCTYNCVQDADCPEGASCLTGLTCG
jgi:hypothetical protein